MTALFPRPFLYTATNGAGFPLIKVDGTIDMTLLGNVARYPLVTLNSTPFADLRTDVVVALRKLNRDLRGQNPAMPPIRILWYDTLVQRFFYATPGTQWTNEWNAITNAKLFAQDGVSFPWNDPNNLWVSLAACADQLIAIWRSMSLWNHLADGCFLDFANGVISGNSVTNSPVDYVRAGYASLTALNNAHTAAFDRIVTALSESGLVVGNGSATLASKSKWAGELYENWPAARGGFEPSLTDYAGWEWPDPATIGGMRTPFRSPYGWSPKWARAWAEAPGQFSIVKMETTVTAYSAEWNRVARFALGAATLRGGFGTAGPDRDLNYTPWMGSLWADEYSVTPLKPGQTDGRTDLTGAHVGWLGRAGAPAYKDSSGIWVRKFEKGLVLVNGGSTTQIDLGAPYWRRIYGNHDTTVNNGLTQRLVTVPATDAVFMLAIPR